MSIIIKRCFSVLKSIRLTNIAIKSKLLMNNIGNIYSSRVNILI